AVCEARRPERPVVRMADRLMTARPAESARRPVDFADRPMAPRALLRRWQAVDVTRFSPSSPTRGQRPCAVVPETHRKDGARVKGRQDLPAGPGRFCLGTTRPGGAPSPSELFLLDF